MTDKANPWRPKFIPIEQREITSISSSEAYKFSIVSYNILAQAFVKSSIFPHSPRPCLRWKARSEAVSNALKYLGTDFLCLQELDEYKFYNGIMESNGYLSVFVTRSGHKRDGCGIFYKQTSAELLLQENIEYNDLVKPSEIKSNSTERDNDVLVSGGNESSEETQDSTKEGGNHGDMNDPRVRLKRDCVGVMTLFRLKNHSQDLIIANTHLYWDPELADVKLAQAKYLLSRLAKFKTRVLEEFECEPPIIVTGDFNSTPGDQVYNYLVSGNSSMEAPIECPDELPIPLCSTYACTRGEPPFTNNTPGFTGTLDYIFFSPFDCLKPVSFLELPDEDSPSVVGGLPNYYHPSDHIPIGAEFLVLPR